MHENLTASTSWTYVAARKRLTGLKKQEVMALNWNDQSPQQQEALKQWWAGNLITPEFQKRIRRNLKRNKLTAVAEYIHIQLTFKKCGIVARSARRLDSATAASLSDPHNRDLFFASVKKLFEAIAIVEAEDRIIEAWRFRETDLHKYVWRNYDVLHHDYAELIAADIDKLDCYQRSALLNVLQTFEREHQYVRNRKS